MLNLTKRAKAAIIAAALATIIVASIAVLPSKPPTPPTLPAAPVSAASAPAIVPPTQAVQSLSPTPDAAAPAPAAQPEDPTFETLYALKEGDPIRRVMPPFIDARLDFYRAANPGQADLIPSGPDAMLVTWKNGKPSPWGMTFGGGGYQSNQLIEYYLKVFAPQIEGDASLRKLVIPGDFVIRENATLEQYRVALEKIISEASGVAVTLTFRDVERPVYVLKGKWQYAPLDALKDQPQRGDRIEVFGRDLNANMSTGGGGSGAIPELAGWISRWIEKQTIIEATDPPAQISWHLNPNGDGTPDSRAKSHDPELVITHIEIQTGLTATLETRKVQRLFIESGKSPPQLP